MCLLYILYTLYHIHTPGQVPLRGERGQHFSGPDRQAGMLYHNNRRRMPYMCIYVVYGV
jgi:hypothetical protein